MKLREIYKQAREIAMNETLRIDIENREKFLHDQATMEWYARLEGRLEGKLDVARRLLEMGMPIEQAIKATELSAEEIQKHLPNLL